jgi:Arc/MetJ-type ribon-helix-helix transcriptional regulator
MKRTTVVLPDELSTMLERERRRRGVSAAEIVREALTIYLGATDQPRHIPFAALGNSGQRDTGRRLREILRSESGQARDR